MAAPGAPFGDGGNEDEGGDVEDDDRADQEEPARDSTTAVGAGAWPAPASASEPCTTTSVATCSLDTLPPHTGARHDAALGPSVAPRGAGYSIVLRNLLTNR